MIKYWSITFIAPFVAIALNDIPVKKVHIPHNEIKTSDPPMPAIPTILETNNDEITYNPT